MWNHLTTAFIVYLKKQTNIISLGFAEKLCLQTPANMDRKNFHIHHPAKPTAALSGPKGLEGATQSGLDLRQACKRYQQLLEITEERHA